MTNTRLVRTHGVHIAAIVGLSLLFTAPGMLPRRVLAPVDMISDFGLWKPDVFERRSVSNGLLSDVVLQFVPWDAEIARRLRAHELPYTDVWSDGGRPLWSNPQTALLCPTTWPRIAFGLSGWAVCIFLRLALAGTGMYVLALALEAAPSAALISGLLYELCGASFVWIFHPHGNTTAFLPWLIVAHLRLLRSPTRGRVGAALAATALYSTGGHPETLLVGGLVAVGVLWSAHATFRDTGRAIRYGVVIALTGILVTGVMWVPFLRILTGPDPPILRGTGKAGSAAWALVGSLVIPGGLGSPIAGELDLTRVVPDAGLYFSRAPAYVGVLTLVAIALAFPGLGRLPRRCAALGGGFLLFATLAPLVPQAARHVPIVDLVNPTYAWLGFAFLTTLTAGFAIPDAFGNAHRRPVGALIVGGGVLLVIVGLLPVLPIASPHVGKAIDHVIAHERQNGTLNSPAGYYQARREEYVRLIRTTAVHRAAVPGWIILCGGLALRSGRRFLFPLLMVGELFVFELGYLPVAKVSGPLVVSPLLDVVQRLDPTHHWMIAAGPNVFPPNLATLAGVRDVRSNDALESPAAMGRLEAAGYDNRILAIRDGLGPDSVSSLKRCGVRFLLSRVGPPGAELRAGGPAPAVGLYDLGRDATTSELPRNSAPPGIRAGFGLSLLGILLGMVQVVVARGAPLAGAPGSRSGRGPRGRAPRPT